MKVENLAVGIIGVVMLFVVTLFVLLLPTLILMWAWNAFMPGMFGFQEVGFLQALALAVLLSFVRSAFNFTFRKT